MKTSILTSLVIAAGLSSPATADDFFFKPTVGADYQFTHVLYKDDGDDFVADNLHGANIHIGARVHKNLGFELGYLKTGERSKSNLGVNTDVKLKGFNFDALGYLPVDNNVDLIGTIGVSRLNAELNASGPIPSSVVASFDETETKGRIGAGAQVWLTPNSNLRAIVRYQGADFEDSVKYAIVGNIGVNYQF